MSADLIARPSVKPGRMFRVTQADGRLPTLHLMVDTVYGYTALLSSRSGTMALYPLAHLVAALHDGADLRLEDSII